MQYNQDITYDIAEQTVPSDCFPQPKTLFELAISSCNKNQSRILKLKTDTRTSLATENVNMIHAYSRTAGLSLSRNTLT